MLTDIANRSRFDRHAADCPRCPIVAETTRKTVELYKRFHPCEVPAAREARVLAAIRARALVKPKLAGVYCERPHANNAETHKCNSASRIACGIIVPMCITPFWVGNTT
jgi:hypothetical protein